MAFQGIITDLRLEDYAKIDDSSAPSGMNVSYFKVGEGGWYLSGSSRVPKDPVSTKTDLESESESNEFTFQKSLGVGDIVVSGEDTVVTCLLESVESGLDGQGLLDGSDPHLYELGVFDANDVLIAYCTFDEIIKVSGVAVTIAVTLNRFASCL